MAPDIITGIIAVAIHSPPVSCGQPVHGKTAKTRSLNEYIK